MGISYSARQRVKLDTVTYVPARARVLRGKVWTHDEQVDLSILHCIQYIWSSLVRLQHQFDFWCVESVCNEVRERSPGSFDIVPVAS